MKLFKHKSCLIGIVLLMKGIPVLGVGKVPHLDLEMTGFEYERLPQNSVDLKAGSTMTLATPHPFDDIFATGKRNLDWIRLLNQHRNVPISLSTAETQQGFPITSPRIYNPEIIRHDYNILKVEMPEALKKIIFGRDPLPNQLPGTLEDFLRWGLAVDRVYQLANRWKTYEPHRAALIENSVNDIRGFYFITQTEGLTERLKNWSQIPMAEQTTIEPWLRQVCLNHLKDRSKCQTLTTSAIQTNRVYEFFSEHAPAGQLIVDGLMKIPNQGRFSTLEWTTSHVAEVPFVEPGDQIQRSFLVDNIQEEWRFFPFALQILFVPTNRYGVKVIWTPGITPHVPALGANTIYMDSNPPISEYDVRWTIRHEFGHVLGFPDCYLEFYDSDLRAIVSYQYDVSDLMCSRRGHLKERHIKELKRVYR